MDFLLDYYALQITFGGAGQSTFSSVNTLTTNLEPAIQLWTDILASPRFDSLEVEVWRDRQLEGVRRRGDDPGVLAVSEFNRIMFGDHPIGWELDGEDLSPERTEFHIRFPGLFPDFLPREPDHGGGRGCPVSEIAPLLDEMVSTWPTCAEPLQESKAPQLREGRKVFLIPKELTQSTVVMAGPGGVSQERGARLLRVQDRELHPRGQRFQQPGFCPGSEPRWGTPTPHRPFGLRRSIPKGSWEHDPDQEWLHGGGHSTHPGDHDGDA